MAEIGSGSRRPLTVFIASPGDVAPERQKLREVVADLNRTVARHLGLVVDATGWEDLPPSVHPERTQELINPSVDQADIFILILWKSLGTADKRGFPTKEEFDRAFDLNKRTGRPRIVLYLKSTPAPPNDIHPSKLANVQAFKKRFSKRVLYRPFDDVEELARFARNDLTEILQQLSTEKPSTETPQPSQQSAPFFLGGKQPASHFVGRKDILERLVARLKEPTISRLAIHGRAGIGKSELVLHLAVRYLLQTDLFPGGILLADLKEASSVRQVYRLWARVLGATAAAQMCDDDRVSDEAIQQEIRVSCCWDRRRRLFILDNSTQSESTRKLLVGGPTSVYLLTTCSHEHALEFAGESGAVLLGDLTELEGFELLKHLCGSLVQGDPVSSHSLLDLLGGHPLTLSVIGRWMSEEHTHGRLRSVADVVTRLEAGGRSSMEAGPAPIPGRSLNDRLTDVILMIERSLDLETRRHFRALLVFPGHTSTFSAAAARHVLGTDLDVVDKLVDLGLIQRVTSSVTETRFSLHGPAHWEGLYPSPVLSADCARSCHERMVEFFLTVLRDHENDDSVLVLERGNIEWSIRLALTLDMDSTVIEMAARFYRFQVTHGLYESASATLQMALQSAERSPSYLGKPGILRRMGHLSYARGQYAKAQSFYIEGLESSRTSESPEIKIEILRGLADVKDRYADNVGAEICLKDALQLAQRAGDTKRECQLLLPLGWVFAHRGQLKEARQCWHTGLEVARASQLWEELACRFHNNLGWVEDRLGNSKEAEVSFSSAEALAACLPDVEVWCVLMTNRGAAAIHRGDYEVAESYLRPALERARMISRTNILQENLAISMIRRGNDVGAEQLLSEGLVTASGIGDPERIAAFLTYLAEYALYRGNEAEAERNLSVGMALARRIGNVERLAGLLLNIGELNTRRCRFDEACGVLQEGLAHAQSMDYKWSISAFHNARGRLFLKRRETERALHEFEAARKIAGCIKSNDNLAYSIVGLGSVAASAGNTKEAERLIGQGRGIFRQIRHRCALATPED